MPPLSPFSTPHGLFSSMTDLHAACQQLPTPDTACQQAIATREATLTKPAGSLGQLEGLTAWLGGWQQRRTPRLENILVLVFAGNHGVVTQGVSPWPPEVTTQMVHNFRQGGAAINQLARQAQAELRVVPVHDLAPTADFTTGPAMTEMDFLKAVQTGYNAVPEECDLLCLGEMGIGNTTAAAALAAALFGGDAMLWAGRGTGLDDAGVRHKARVIETALTHNAALLGDPLETARALGGYELAALLGATLAARHKNVPVMLDGYVCTAAVAPLARLAEHGLAHTWLSHCSAETGHARLARAVRLRPLLDLDLRLGEASGAALAVPIVRAALACHTGMATFAQAAVSERA
ncbi:nicotinate-nucleotide--dimethylbenzimidazole phosphoribosyltransferase [Acetobacter senegalensis]|uniref:Nicotinate-nucleotide--dimethylbenzimidazole phosphoribosyltransferase n=1 Tax=Acetobacter senegalensis TaxID=446692 RepID=A0A0U5EXC8_9PROT|nr:nicotinate-nucleotide--dimethylbenzimidazole phosphoribosyltransferase [Acetobacter senegalensis]MCG4258743.1 nicotinate-nucleotide--dimethylbenzimidazole phosphoribosyltransferase [Acetobacter senegalensis]MCG4268690.1 nicotinate-nucleotide--dimethylbenzimidazole phosphoribosyltransferase [Acetobacter senegalensis]MPQ74529.1 nicotinate-nucleotide--dimethylbenzimidazole phosphoribosyltransferase [Acetobacter senegalensis]CEF40280.1 nicotinate-nucleotide--dimethylbenzimidazole phosphoribosylt